MQASFFVPFELRLTSSGRTPPRALGALPTLRRCTPAHDAMPLQSLSYALPLLGSLVAQSPPLPEARSDGHKLHTHFCPYCQDLDDGIVKESRQNHLIVVGPNSMSDKPIVRVGAVSVGRFYSRRRTESVRKGLLHAAPADYLEGDPGQGSLCFFLLHQAVIAQQRSHPLNTQLRNHAEEK